MAHSFSRNHVHLVCTTKHRRNTISKDWQLQLWAYLAGICKYHEMIALAVGGTENHVHILFHLAPKIALPKAAALLKANSSKWIGEQGIEFSWQEGYGAFSVSSSNLDQVARFIQNQEAHHRKTSFEDEFRALLQKHGVELGSEIRFWVAMCRPSGAWFSARTRSHRSRGGLRCFVPGGTGGNPTPQSFVPAGTGNNSTLHLV